MDLQQISLTPLRGLTVAVLGYGNQGRAQALNLRDSGVNVVVGGRPGKSLSLAKEDKFTILDNAGAARAADIIMLLLPDQTIGEVYQSLKAELTAKKAVGFAHGFAYHFKQLGELALCGHFLVGPKGAGAILRKKFEKGGGLPGVFALGENATDQTRQWALAYAKGIGVATSVLIETTFQQETESDLFGEQAVLCGGIMRLMENAFGTLVENGISPEMAFFESCYEAKLILDLWVAHGPAGMAAKISPTAFYGGTTRGERLIGDSSKREMAKIFQEIRSGDFATEWLAEVRKGTPRLTAERQRLAASQLEKTYEQLTRDGLRPEP